MVPSKPWYPREMDVHPSIFLENHRFWLIPISGSEFVCQIGLVVLGRSEKLKEIAREGRTQMETVCPNSFGTNHSVSRCQVCYLLLQNYNITRLNIQSQLAQTINMRSIEVWTGETWWDTVKHGETRWNMVKHGDTVEVVWSVQQSSSEVATSTSSYSPPSSLLSESGWASSQLEEIRRDNKQSEIFFQEMPNHVKPCQTLNPHSWVKTWLYQALYHTVPLMEMEPPGSPWDRNCIRGIGRSTMKVSLLFHYCFSTLSLRLFKNIHISCLELPKVFLVEDDPVLWRSRRPLCAVTLAYWVLVVSRDPAMVNKALKLADDWVLLMFLIWFLIWFLIGIDPRSSFIVPPRCHLTLFFVMVDSLYCGLTLAMQDLASTCSTARFDVWIVDLPWPARFLCSKTC